MNMTNKWFWIFMIVTILAAAGSGIICIIFGGDDYKTLAGVLFGYVGGGAITAAAGLLGARIAAAFIIGPALALSLASCGGASKPHVDCYSKCVADAVVCAQRCYEDPCEEEANVNP